MRLFAAEVAPELRARSAALFGREYPMLEDMPVAEATAGAAE